jgi:hypothetical protein
MMRRRAILFAAVAWTIGITGCHKTTFYQDPRAFAGIHHEEWTDFFIFGLVGTEELDVREFCGNDEVAAVRTGSNFATGLVSVLTIGIYTPHKFYVTCAARAASAHASSRRLAPLRSAEIALDRRGNPVEVEITTPEGRSSTRHIVQTGPQAFRVRYAPGASL